MTRVLIALAIAVIFSGTQSPPSRTIAIDFVALDRAGNPVMDLKPAEVEVWIGQFRTPIDTFTPITSGSPEYAGRLVVLLLDDVTLSPEAFARVAEAARAFVKHLADRDAMAVVSLSGTQNMETTNERARLLSEISRYSVRATGTWRADTIGRHILETLSAISQSIVEAPGRRKTIVGIGSGVLLDRPLPNPVTGTGDLLPEWVHAMRSMAFSKTNFYVIDPRGVGITRSDGGDTGFARETGGHAFLSVNDLDDAADRILREASNYYVVTVPDPPVGGKADLRELNVKSLRRGVTIRSRHAIPGS